MCPDSFQLLQNYKSDALGVQAALKVKEDDVSVAIPESPPGALYKPFHRFMTAIDSTMVHFDAKEPGFTENDPQTGPHGALLPHPAGSALPPNT